MSYLSIEGGAPLHGELTIQGSKNSVLPVLAATILARDVCRIENCPRLRDVDASVAILRHLGCRVRRDGTALEVDTAPMARCDIPDELMREMRSSIIFLGAILARQGEAVLSYPGGCELGPRPIDLHLAALRELGAEITERFGELRCKAKCLRGTDITLAIPSVGATENAILAACGAEGTSVIYNAAREPEIVDLQALLRSMGARVNGAGGSIITVEGGAALYAPRHRGPHRLRDLPLRRGGGGRRGAAHRCGLPRGVHRGALARRERLRGEERGGRRFPALDRSAALCAPRAYRALSGLPDRRPARADGGAAQERGLHGLC